MNGEPGLSPIDATNQEALEEVDRLNKELDSLPQEDKSKRVQGIRSHLESLGVDTTNMDQRDMVMRFVSEEAKGLLGQN